ncbi:MAG: cell division protein HetF [Nostoc sp. ChiSLP01]|nr:CHAT domain-containing protein [Nostoc sp. CmiSLP01]MDZ8286138.1 CHAT domain-containing protein [Nostoc sp. ChiSLP01]
MTQEFHISVTPVGQNDYLVRTEQVAPGVPLAEELVTWPVADWLMAAGHLMNDPLKSVLQGDPFAPSGRESDIARNSVNLVALGQQLYNALFQGTLRDSWITAQGIAQNHQQVLRLRLGLKDTRLARLPWEVMHAGDRPLATGPYVAFSRFQSGILGASRLRSLRGATPTPNTFTPLEETGVKVLMVIASPLDQVRLDLLKQEAIKLQAELARPAPRFAEASSHLPEIELTVLDQPGREELTQALEQGRYHVLHYSGHSNLGPNGGEIYLASRRTGLTEILTGDDLAGLLVNNNIQMAVFNSCLGAYTAALGASEDTGERNLAESLVKRGIASVLAMSERIPDEVALTLTQLFYRNLSQGYPVDLCVSRVRQGLISAYGSHQMYWALPILYLQPEFDGFLSQETTLGQSPESNQYSSPVGTIPSSMYAAIADDPEMPLGIEEMIPADLGRDSSGLDWLGEDTWGDLVDEIEYDDPSYAEDSAIVSDLFRRLDEQKSSTEIEQQINENSLPNRPVSEEMTSSLEEADLWGEVPAPPPETVVNSERHWQNSEFSRRSQPTPSPSRNRNPRRKLWPIVSVVGISAIAIAIGLNWWQNRPQANLSKIPPIPTESLPIGKQPNIDLETAPTGIVTATATEKLSQGDLQAGLFAVEELLNRGAFAAAETALKLVINKQVDDPSVNFLKGRLAWQSIQTGDVNYSVDDARRYWETAAKAKPDSLLYNNALGFAYYAEGNLNRANDSWFKALNLALKAQNTASTTPTKTSLPQDALTSYAGLALGLYKSALGQSSTKQAQYMNEAIKLRQMVMKSDRVNFQVDKLAKNWLWTEKAIKDWRSLLQEKSREE